MVLLWVEMMGWPTKTKAGGRAENEAVAKGVDVILVAVWNRWGSRQGVDGADSFVVTNLWVPALVRRAVLTDRASIIGQVLV